MEMITNHQDHCLAQKRLSTTVYYVSELHSRGCRFHIILNTVSKSQFPDCKKWIYGWNIIEWLVLYYCSDTLLSYSLLLIDIKQNNMAVSEYIGGLMQPWGEFGISPVYIPMILVYKVILIFSLFLFLLKRITWVKSFADSYVTFYFILN